MKTKIILALLLITLAANVHAQQGKRYDSTMKLGKAGYRVRCNNKNVEKNSLNVNPIGFENGVRDVDLEVKGRVNKAEIDDLNNDGFPELVLYVVNTADKNKINIFCISSKGNSSMAGVYFPDILDDPKLRVGYNGNDEYELLQGTLLRRFPLYTTDSTDVRPTGLYRQVQYTVVTGERGELRFKVLRSYDYDKNKK